MIHASEKYMKRGIPQCGGHLEEIGTTTVGGLFDVIEYRCTKCGKTLDQSDAYYAIMQEEDYMKELFNKMKDLEHAYVKSVYDVQHAIEMLLQEHGIEVYYATATWGDNHLTFVLSVDDVDRATRLLQEQEIELVIEMASVRIADTQVKL